MKLLLLFLFLIIGCSSVIVYTFQSLPFSVSPSPHLTSPHPVSLFFFIILSPTDSFSKPCTLFFLLISMISLYSPLLATVNPGLPLPSVLFRLIHSLGVVPSVLLLSFALSNLPFFSLSFYSQGRP